MSNGNFVKFSHNVIKQIVGITKLHKILIFQKKKCNIRTQYCLIALNFTHAEKSLKIFRACSYRKKLKIHCERGGQRILLGHLRWLESHSVTSEEGRAGTATATTAPQRQIPAT